MRRWTVSAPALAALLFAAPAPAQVRVDINPYAGVFVFDDDELEERGLEIDPGAMIGARLGVGFGDRVQVEAAYGFVRGTLEPSEFVSFPDPADEGADVDMHLFYGALNFFVLDPDVRTKLLLAGGAGVIAVDAETGQDRGSDFMIELGVGFTHPVNEWITFRGDVRDHLTFCSDEEDPGEFSSCVGDETLNHVEITAGLEFWLN